MALDFPHRRYNPLLDEWLLVAPHRAKRPWSGQEEKSEEVSVPSFDPKNPLCPGVTRPNGVINPSYESTFLFTNDFPALLPDAPEVDQDDPLFKASTGRGTCEVMCFHPRSDLELGTMSADERVKVIRGWQGVMDKLSPQYAWVQVFENKGAIMGCSNPHPHCQIWATDFLPNHPAIKDRTQRDYLAKFGKPLLVDYLEKELVKKERLVVETLHWVALVPYWAVWPYETMLLPRRHVLRLTDLSEEEVVDLAEAMRQLLVRYDNLFRCRFPYRSLSMGWHGAPTGRLAKEENGHWQLHALYLPPLLRSATVRKFMAGFELVSLTGSRFASHKETLLQKLRLKDSGTNPLFTILSQSDWSTDATR